MLKAAHWDLAVAIELCLQGFNTGRGNTGAYGERGRSKSCSATGGGHQQGEREVRERFAGISCNAL